MLIWCFGVSKLLPLLSIWIVGMFWSYGEGFKVWVCARLNRGVCRGTVYVLRCGVVLGEFRVGAV